MDESEKSIFLHIGIAFLCSLFFAFIAFAIGFNYDYGDAKTGFYALSIANVLVSLILLLSYKPRLQMDNAIIYFFSTWILLIGAVSNLFNEQVHYATTLLDFRCALIYLIGFIISIFLCNKWNYLTVR